MGFSPDSSQEENRIASRELYRAGVTKPAAKSAPEKKKKDKGSLLGRLWGSSKPAEATTNALPPPGSLGSRPPQLTANNAKPKQPKQPSRLKEAWQRHRKYILAVLGLLFLGTVSYCICLPDPVERAKQELQALRNDPNMDGREKWEKSREIFDKLTDKQKGDMFKERFRAMNKRTREFFKKSKEEQYAELKKQVQEGEKRRAEREARRAANGGGGGGRGGAGGGGGRGGAGGGGGRGGAGGAAGGAGGGRGGAGGQGAGGRGGGGPGGGGPGGPGGGRRDPSNHTPQKNGLDMSSPEDRANRHLYRGMMGQVRQSMGMPAGGGGFFGPPGGGRGGPPR